MKSLTSNRKTLAGKFNRIAIVMAILVVSLTSVFLVYKKYQLSSDKLVATVLASARQPSFAADYAIYYRKPESLQAALHKFINDPDMSYAALYDSSGKLLTEHEKEALALQPFSQLRSGLSAPDETISEPQWGDELRRYDLVVPVFSSINPYYADIKLSRFAEIMATASPGDTRYVMGYIRLVVNEHRLILDIKSFATNLSAAAALLVLFYALGVLIMTRRVTAPLRQIIVATQQIADGDFDHKLKVKSKDELQEVAASLNTMSHGLQSYKTKLEGQGRFLAMKVEERTGQLSERNKDLKKAISEAMSAKEVAEQANSAKSQFLAAMSHEIRTPLNGVLGMAELLSKSELSGQQEQFVSTITESGNSLLDTINDILDFSKIEAGKLELNYSTFGLRKFCEDTVRMFAGLAQKKGLDIKFKYPADLSLLVEGDSVRLRQVLSNLISNAIKFTHKGGVELVIGASAREGKNATLTFEVMDTGIGLAPDKVKTIFKSFTQADSSTTRKYGGTGLGLAITKQLVDLMGGDIRVTSKTGQGASFLVSINCQVEEEALAIPSSHADYLNKANVLLLGDETYESKALIDQLKVWDAGCKAVMDEAEFIATLETERFDVAVVNESALNNSMEDVVGNISQHLDKLKLIIVAKDNYDIDRLSRVNAAHLRVLSKPVYQSDFYNALIELLAGVKTQPKKSNSQTKKTLAASKGTHISGRVLLAEDTAVNQEVTTTMLEHLGYEATVVENGKEALNAFVDGKYDLILMDCQMPVMDGYTASVAIRNHQRFRDSTQQKGRKHTPIVALTANVIEGEREKCIEAGMDDYLAKPVAFDDLQAMLEKWVQPSESTLVKPVEKSPDSVQDEKSVALEQVASAEMSEVEAKVAPKSVLAPSAVAQPAVPQATMPQPTMPQPTHQSSINDTDASVVDLNALDQLKALQKEGSDDVVTRIIKVYLRESVKTLESLSDAEINNDTEGLYKAAHSLKSSSLNVGANGLADLCKRVEAIGRNGSMEGITPLMRSIETEYRKVKAFLSKEVKPHGQSISA